MSHSHAIIWMDSREAHVFKFNKDDVETDRIKAHLPFSKVHHKAGVIGSGHMHTDHAYCHEVAEALSGVQEWILAGPGMAKEDMERYLSTSLPELHKTLLAVEPMDHPTDNELVAHARRFFKAADRMRSNAPSIGRG